MGIIFISVQLPNGLFSHHCPAANIEKKKSRSQTYTPFLIASPMSEKKVLELLLQDVGGNFLSSLVPESGRELEPLLMIQPGVDIAEILELEPRYVNYRYV